MEYSIIQIALVFVVTFIAAIDQFDFLESLYQPIVTGAVIGLILGDLNTGLLVGGTYQLMTIGNMPIGGAQPPNAVIGGIMAAILAIATGLEPNAAVGLAIHPQIQLVHRLAAGELVPVRVQKVWPALEHLHAKTPARMQPRQRRRHRGLALPRGRGGNQQSGAAGGGLCHGIPGRWCGHWGAHFRPTNSVRPGVA